MSHESEVVVSGESGLVLQEIRRLGKAVDDLGKKLDDKLEKLDERVRRTEVDLAKVPTAESVKDIADTQKAHGEAIASITVKVGIGAAIIAGAASFLAHVIFH